ncbi:conserved protein of unknown function [Pararobbsia alpina]|uniref:hypothetical protein n=1 Tax=Pararobbsia alpina TaxID=621374 RepID=UPI0039A737B6
MRTLAQLAGMWCNDLDFRAWVAELSDQACATAADAAAWVRAVCNVESRAELNTDHDAAARFNQLIRTPYMAHRERADTF